MNKGKSWQQQLKSGSNPHALLFNKERPRDPRFIQDPLSPSRRRKIEQIKENKTYGDLEDLREVWD